MKLALSGAMPTGSNMGVITRLAQQQPDLVWAAAVPHLGDTQAGMAANYQRMIVGEIGPESADPARGDDLETYVQASVPESARRPFTGYTAAVKRNARVRQEVIPEVDRWIATEGDPTLDVIERLSRREE